ncbi:MAG: MFS transporter [Anaerolineaceae bacterium]|nr:MFS transporter [Anaerolineaceae bacterium]
MFSINPRKRDARSIYLFFSVGMAVCFAMSFMVMMVFVVQTVGLSPLQLVLAGTALEVTIFICEVPTGIIADVYSRRLSIVIGYFIIGLAFVFQSLVPTFVGVILINVLWGLGYTFTSGATEAWIIDEIGDQEVGKLFLRSSRLSNLLGIAATIIGIILGSLLITLPILAAGLLFLVIAVVMVLYMPETGFHPTPVEDRSTFGQMAHTLRAGVGLVRVRPMLIAILGIGLFFGLYSEGLDRLGDAHLLRSFTLPDFHGLPTVAWLGALGLIGNFITALLTRVMEKRLDMKRSQALARASFGLAALLVASLFGFGLAGSFVMAVILNWCIGSIRTLLGPINTTWINQHIDSSVRATVISLTSQVDAFGQIVGGPPVGFIGERLGIRAALISSGLILSPVLYLYTRIIRADMRAAKGIGSVQVQPSVEA